MVLLDTDDPATDGCARLGYFLDDVRLKVEFLQVILLQLPHGPLGHRFDIKIVKSSQKVLIYYHFLDVWPTWIFAQKQH